MAAICQASSLVQNNRCTVKQGFYPTLIYKQLFQEKKIKKQTNKKDNKKNNTPPTCLNIKLVQMLKNYN